MTIALALLLPLLAAALMMGRSARPYVLAFTPWIPLAALPVAVAPPATVEIDFLLLGMRFGLEPWSQVLLAGTALLWTCAGWALRLSGAVTTPRLLAWHLSLAGNLGAILAMDAPGFYLFFALMSLAAYGVVVNTRRARRAGWLYLVVALLGELLLLAGLLLLTLEVTGPVTATLLLFGLGAKLGILPLHFPLPPAYAATDAAGAAVFGGGLTLAAVAGWLRFLPGVQPQPELGEYALIAGLAAAFLAALAGLLQRNSRALLGYSTISQMGILTAGLGLTLASPTPIAAAPLAFFAVHHGLNKAALLLGTGSGGPLVFAGLVLLSLTLAGVPLSSGAVAKAWLESMGETAPALTDTLHHWLPFTSTATALLMAKFLWLVHKAPRSAPAAPFLILALLALIAPWAGIYYLHPAPGELIKFGAAVRPLLIATAILAIGWPLRKRLGRWHLPPGDLAVLDKPVAQAMRKLLGFWRGRELPRLPRLYRLAPERLERQLRTLPVTGLALFALLLAFAVALSL